jgi:polysaccharide transporter, PST family
MRCDVSEVSTAEKAPEDDFSKKSLRGGAVSVMAQALNTSVQVGTTICLARLLLPEDFGLVAMVSAMTGFANVLMDLGTRDAAVQRPQITQEELSSLFWLTTGLGILFTTAIALAAPLIAEFYHEDRLIRIAQFWGLAFVFTALSCQHAALLRRNLMFRKIAVIEVAANVLGAATAIVVALSGGGYWALVSRPLVTAIFMLVLVWSNSRWVPGLPGFSQGVRETVRFGMHITGFTITDYVAKAADRVGLGYTVGARELGYYQSASTVYENALTVVTLPLHSVAVATLSKLRDNLDELRRAWSTALSALAFFAMPAFVVLAVIGSDLIVLLLGQKWATAGTILTIFALRGPAQVVERTLGWLHIAAGRADRWMRWGVFSCVIQVVAILCGLPYGPIGVATSYTLCMYLLFVPAIVYAGQPLQIGFTHLMRAIGPQLVGSLCAALVGFAIRSNYLSDVSPLQRMSLLSIACIMGYGMITVGIFRMTKPIEVAGRLLVDFLPFGLSRLLRLRTIN